MPDTPLTQLSAHGQSVWVDFLSRTFVRDGELAALVARASAASRRTRRSSRPRSPTATPTTSSSARCSRPRPSPRRSSSRSPSRTSATRATCCARSGTTPARTPATAGSRSRSTRSLAHDTEATIAEAKRLHALVDRPNLFIKIPATQGGPARDRGDDRRRHPRQRDADLLARPPPRGRRGLHPRRAALRRRRRRPRRDGLGRVLLRLARRHRGRQAPRRDRRPRRAQGHARDRQRQARLPDLQGASSPATQWEALGAKGALGAALPVGVDVDQEPRLPRRALRRGADRRRHREHDAARDRRGGPGPRRGRATRSTRTSTARARTLEAFEAAGIDYDDVVETLEREGVEKFAKSFEQLFADVEAKRTRW